MFKRKIYSKMQEWKKESDGKTALLIEGARRIGKSTVVEEFAKNEYESYILIDFSRASKETRELFEDVSDLNFLFLQLQLQYKVDLKERKSVIIFDEVQLCPPARQAIKTLVADHRYDYIETGSLISIKKNVKDILIPSEERKISMYPMDYEEFLWAIGDTATFSLLKKCFDMNQGLGDSINRKQLRQFRLYMLVGGMPQAVSAYIETNNFRKVDEIKRDILNLYESDFAKIDPTGRLAMLFDAVPAQLNKNAARYQTSSVLNGEKQDKILELIAELKDSKTVLVAYNTNDPDIGMANGNELFYHTIMNEKSKHNYEIDFILARKNKIVPIEVKSSGYKTHKSLDVFTEKYSSRILKRYLVYTKDMSKDQDIFCMPVYMVPFL